MEMEATSPDSKLQIDKLIAELVALDDPKSFSEKYSVLSHEIKGRRCLNLDGSFKEYHGTAKSKALAIILEMVDCSSLLSLSLGRNGLRPADMTTLTRLAKLPELETLRLNDNELGDDGVKVLAMSLGIGWVPSLQELRISRCRVRSAGLTDLGNAFGTGNVSRSLKVLDLGGNRPWSVLSEPDGHGALTQAMSSGYLPALEELCLQDCGLQSISFKQYADAISEGHEGQLALPVLKIIDFSSNRGLRSDKIEFLAKALSRGGACTLREIHFSYNDIGDLDLELDPVVHSSATQLRKLVLRGPQLTDKGFKSIAKLVSDGRLKSLEVLDVSYNLGCNEGLRSLCTSLESGKSTHLRELLLADTGIGDEDLVVIARAARSGHLKSLEVLDVSRPGYWMERRSGLFALAISSEYGQLSHLRELDVSGWSGEGMLAVARAFEFGHLKSLQVLKIFNTSGLTAWKFTRTIFWQLNNQVTVLTDFRFREDIFRMGFKWEEAYNPQLVLCLYDVLVSSEIVQIVFFHVEGMASLLGIGLPFSRVSIGSELKIVVEEMSEDEYVCLWMNDRNSFKPVVFERGVENPTATSSSILDLSITEAVSRFGVGVDGRNHFIRQNAKSESESNIVNSGVSWLTESWFNQVLEKRRQEIEEEKLLAKRRQEKEKERLDEVEFGKMFNTNRFSSNWFFTMGTEPLENYESWPITEFAKEETWVDESMLMAEPTIEERVVERKVTTKPPTEERVAEKVSLTEPATEERVVERMVTTKPATEERVAKKVSTTELAIEESVAKRMAITERKATTSAHVECLTTEKQDHKGKQLVGAHEGVIASRKQEDKEKELGGAYGETIALEKLENQEQDDAPEGDSRCSGTVGGSGWSFWPQRNPTTKESMDAVVVGSAEELGTSSTSQDARVAKAPPKNVSNLTDDKMLIVFVEMNHLDCQLFEHLSQAILDIHTIRADPVLSKCFIKPTMIIEFISSRRSVRVGNSPISNTVNVRLEVDYQIDGNIKDSEKFGWYQDHLRLSFKCEDPEATSLREQAVIGSKFWEGTDSTMIRSSKSSLKASNKKGRIIVGSRNIAQGEAQVGKQSESMHGSTNANEKGVKYEIECLEKASSFAITPRSGGNEMAYQADLRRDIAPVQDDKLWDEEQRERAANEIAGMFSGARVDVRGTWRLIGNENKVHVFAAEKHLLQHTKENVQEATVNRTFLEWLKPGSNHPVVSTIRSTLQTLEQKISKKFLLNHSFSHLNNIEVLKKDTPYEWILVQREESPVRELISLPAGASGLV